MLHAGCKSRTDVEDCSLDPPTLYVIDGDNMHPAKSRLASGDAKLKPRVSGGVSGRQSTVIPEKGKIRREVVVGLGVGRDLFCCSVVVCYWHW